MKVVAIVGSIRKESYNLKLAKYIQTRYQDRFDLEILNIRDLPFYDQDIENDPPLVVKEFKSKVLIGKPSWIMGASMGQLGTVKAQLHLREILFAIGISSPLLPGNEVYVGAVHDKIDNEGSLIHESTVQFIDTVVDNFISWYNHHTR